MVPPGDGAEFLKMAARRRLLHPSPIEELGQAGERKITEKRDRAELKIGTIGADEILVSEDDHLPTMK